MEQKCPECGNIINDNTRDCPKCRFRVREYNLLKKVQMLEDAIDGWRNRVEQLEDRIEMLHQNITINGPSDVW